MSNQEYCQQLYQEYFKTSQEFLSLNRELPHTTALENVPKHSRYTAIKQQWQTALHNYWDFLSLLKAKAINPNDEFQLT